MFLILFAAFLGTAAAVPVLWPYGVLATLVVAPLSGSFLGLIASVWLTRSITRPRLPMKLTAIDD